MGNKPKTSSRTVDYKVVKLDSPSSSNFSTVAVHFTTQESNQFCDFTDFILKYVEESDLVNGSVNLYTPHTTTCFIINEAETGYINDFKSSIEEVIPSEKYYEHDDWEKRTENMQEDEFKNGRSHVRAAIVGSPNVTVPVVESELLLGRWQRIFFVELDCSRDRRFFVQIAK
ncbi:MAG: YjbQ family protein [Candidatus Actinomarinales bacterium]|nr:MAG: YjbQ family protein [Candidatus Actinomarinales bacterium]|tara:strand:+ start:465 stop:980 length:516 start_codon:yes stop_codon:yes gene_type:complete